MSDTGPETTTDASTETADTTNEPTGQQTETTVKEDSTDWKAEARKWETRAKDNSEAAARLKENEDAQKSTEERLTGQVDELTKERDDLKVDLLRLRAAIKHGLDEDDLDLLGNGSEEDIEKRAQRLAAKSSTDAPKRRTNRTLGRTEEAKVDPDAWLRDAGRRR